MKNPIVDAASQEILLVFPPLVETNFGRYYPSTAVLSGFLDDHGIACGQRDLNNEFADLLFDPQNLQMVTEAISAVRGDDEVGRVAVDALRVLAHHSDRWARFGAGGLDWDRAEGILFKLMKRASYALRIDETLAEVVEQDALNGPIAALYDRLLDVLLEKTPFPSALRLCGVSVAMGPQLLPALLVARAVKKRIPSARVVLGGPVISLLADDGIETLLTYGGVVDAAVRYDGELPLAGLAEQSTRGSWHPSDIAGVISLKDGTVHYSKPTPGPRMSGVAVSKFDEKLMEGLETKEVALTQARGCYWGQCSYCDYVELYRPSNHYRPRTAESFVDELQHQIRTHGATRCAVITEAMPPAFARRFAQLLIERRVDVGWYSFVMVDSRFDHDTFSMMRDSGCEELIVGMETLNDRVLALVHKAANGVNNVDFVGRASKAGIKLVVNLIPDLPTTTAEEARETLRVLETLADKISEVSVFPFEATKSSMIGRYPERFGLTFVQAPSSGTVQPQAQFAANHQDYHDPAMTPGERKEIILEYRAFADRVNGTGLSGKWRWASGSIATQEACVIADDFLSWTPTGNGLSVYHGVRHEYLAIPAPWHRAIESVRNRQPLTIPEIREGFDSAAIGGVVTELLVKNGLLRPAEAAI